MEPERCAECGFDATLLTVSDAITALRSIGRRWRELFKDAPEERLRTRPDTSTWSPLEYAAHTRDVIAMIGWGMNKVLEGGRPAFDPIEPDPPGTDHGYNALDSAEVLDALAANADRMAARASRAIAQHWNRTASVGDTNPDAGWFLRHAVHDATHHLRDVEKQLAA